MFFDTEKEEAATGFEPIPDGTYRAVIVGMPYRATKSGTGSYLAATFQIAEGPHEGRMVFQNFNVENVSEKAQQIGRAQFKQLLSALRVTEALAGPDDAARVCQDKIVTIRVSSQKDQRDGSMRNNVKEYLSESGAKVARAPSVTKMSDDLTKIPF